LRHKRRIKDRKGKEKEGRKNLIFRFILFKMPDELYI